MITQETAQHRTSLAKSPAMPSAKLGHTLKMLGKAALLNETNNFILVIIQILYYYIILLLY